MCGVANEAERDGFFGKAKSSLGLHTRAEWAGVGSVSYGARNEASSPPWLPAESKKMWGWSLRFVAKELRKTHKQTNGRLRPDKPARLPDKSGKSSLGAISFYAFLRSQRHRVRDEPRTTETICKVDEISAPPPSRQPGRESSELGSLPAGYSRRWPGSPHQALRAVLPSHSSNQ